MTILRSGKSLAISAIALAMSAGVASAQSYSGSWRDRFNSYWSDRNHDSEPTYSQVPEIDASAGLLAMAAVAAALVLVWELRRRRAKA